MGRWREVVNKLFEPGKNLTDFPLILADGPAAAVSKSLLTTSRHCSSMI